MIVQAKWWMILAGLVMVISLGSVEEAGGEEMGKTWEFLNAEDCRHIRDAATKPFGEPVVAEMKKKIAERLQYDLVAPASEAGHFHHYFCPVHNCVLKFDWESPQAHLCPECGKHLTGERYDWAWRVLANGLNGHFMHACAFMHVITGERAYQEYIRDLLVDYARRYPTWPNHGHDLKNPAPYGGRMYSQTLDESMWACRAALAYRQALPIMSASEVEHIRDNLLRPLAESIFGHRAGGNWQVWHNAGIASLAIALEDEQLLDVALNDPDHGYEQMLATGVTGDGWWLERTPGYHFFTLNAMYLTAEAVRCRGIDLYDARMKQMFMGPLDSVFPDTCFPAHNDGSHGFSLVKLASQYEMAYLRFGDEIFRRTVAAARARGYEGEWTTLMLDQDIPPDAEPLQLESVLQEDTGVAYLRSGERAVVFKFGEHGGGHGHPDKLSIGIHDGTQEILPDLGTCGYGAPDYIQWYRKTLSHNTVVMDQRDQQEATGKLIDFQASAEGGKVIADCSEAYGPGVVLRRELELAGDVLSDTFTCQATAEHEWEYVLILSVPTDVPTEAVDAQLPKLSGYDRLRDVRQWPGAQENEFVVEGHQLMLSCSQPCQLIRAEAPGIPAAPSDKDTELGTCYPLIMRARGDEVVFRAQWTFDAEEDQGK